MIKTNKRQHSKLTNHLTPRLNNGNECRSGLGAERVSALGSFCSLWSKKKLTAEKWKETSCLSVEENNPWIDDYVETETDVIQKWVQDAENVIKHEQDKIRHAENAGLTTRKPQTSCAVILNTSGNSLSRLACSHNEEEGDDMEGDEDTELVKLSDDDKPRWVMGPMCTMVEHRKQGFQSTQIWLDELTQPGWENQCDNIREITQKQGTVKSKILAVI